MTIKNEQNVPKLRFKGFADSWEQHKFGDVFNVLQNNTLARDQLDKSIGAAKNVHYGDVLIKYGEVTKAAELVHEYIAPVTANKFKSSFLSDGDIVFADTAEDETAGKCTEIIEVGIQKVISGLHTIPCHPKEVFAGGFLGFCLNSPSFHDQLLSLMQGAKVTSISKSALNTTFICYPKLMEEQKMIGATLLSLNTLITLHQCKLSKLQDLKKALLAKMFPSEGEDVPAVRFKGFTDAWGHRKLGDFSIKVISKNTNHIINETLTNSAEEGIISQSDYFDRQISNDDNVDGYYVVDPDDFVYNPRISTKAPVGPINRNRLGRKGIVSPLYTVFRSDDTVNKLFLEYYFKTACWYLFMRYNGDSGARSDRFSIKNELFFSMALCLPSLDEQERIGKLLDQVDNLITLHQRKLAKLKNIKKALLNEMFPGGDN